jgi:hypothetical protein
MALNPGINYQVILLADSSENPFHFDTMCSTPFYNRRTTRGQWKPIVLKTRMNPLLTRMRYSKTTHLTVPCERGISWVEVDGRRMDGEEIPLGRDFTKHRVVVRMGKPGSSAA